MIIPPDLMSPTFRVPYQHGTGKAVPEPGAPLDDGQKAHICILAREAFEHVHGRPPSSQAEFDHWRRAEQERACGVSSLRAATQAEYKSIEARFLKIKGEAKAASRAAARAATEPARLAMFKLRDALRERGLDESYAAAICRKQFKRSLSEASERQLWCLVYTVRNRRKPVDLSHDDECAAVPPSHDGGHQNEAEPDWQTLHTANEAVNPDQF